MGLGPKNFSLPTFRNINQGTQFFQKGGKPGQKFSSLIKRNVREMRESDVLVREQDRENIEQREHTDLLLSEKKKN